MTTETAILIREPGAGIAPQSDSMSDGPFARSFVGLVWLAMTCAALLFVAAYGNHLPRHEDWYSVPIITGEKQVDPAWFFESEMGHRSPVGRSILLLNIRAFGLDFKPMLYLNVLLFSGLALGLSRLAHRARGFTSYCDAFFPVVLLNLGHAESFCWAQAFLYVLSTTLGGVLLMLIVSRPRPLSPAGVLTAGVTLLILPLVYGGGVVFAACMSVWLIHQGFLIGRSDGPTRARRGAVAIAFGVGALALVTLALGGHKGYLAAPSAVPIEPGPTKYLITAWKHLTIGLGPAAARPLWPVSGVLVAGLFLMGAFCLLRQLGRQRLNGDARVLGLAFILASCLTVSVAVGVGKCTWGEIIFDSRYAATSVLALIALYFAWEFSGPPSLLRLGRFILFGTATAFLAGNTNWALALEPAIHKRASAFEQAVREGRSIPYIVSRNTGDATYLQHDRLASWMRQLRDARIPPFDRLPGDETFRSSRLPLMPVAMKNVAWDGGSGRVLGADASLTFELERPTYVCAVRVTCGVAHPRNIGPFFKVEWAGSEGGGASGSYPFYNLNPEGKAETIEFYIFDKIKSITIFPNNRPSSFSISRIEILEPQTENRAISAGTSGEKPAAGPIDGVFDHQDLPARHSVGDPR